MKKILWLVIIVLVVAGVLSTTNVGIIHYGNHVSHMMPEDMNEMKLQLYYGHNAERINQGKIPLVVSPLLNLAAQQHAEWMAYNQTLSHTGLNGSKVWNRVENVGYYYFYVGENIAYGYNEDVVLSEWLKSPGHYNNIVNPHFTEIGIGVAYAADGTKYWAVVFGSPTR